MIDSIPRIITGIFSFTGAGYDAPKPLGSGVSYTVPADKRTQLIYLRAGNSSAEMICLVLMRDGKPMRMFPIGAKAAEHVPLAVVEDLFPDTRLQVVIAAPMGVTGSVVLDLGLMEI